MDPEGGGQPPRSAAPGVVVSVSGGKGGVGTTQVAAGLAAFWHRRGKAVALLQLADSGTGELELLFPGLPVEPWPPSATTPRLPGRALGPALYRSAPESGGGPGSEGVCHSRPPADLVVVDCSHARAETTGAAWLWSDVVLVVGTPDLLGVRSAVRGLQQVAHQGLDGARRGAVLNRAGLPGGVAVEEAGAALGEAWWGVLPESREEARTMLLRGLAECPAGPWVRASEALAASVEQRLAVLPTLPREAPGEGVARLEGLPVQTAQGVLRRLIHRLGDLDRGEKPAVQRRRVTEAAATILDEEVETQHLPRRERERLVLRLVDEVLGLGVLESLLRDPGVTEVMINGPERVYVEKEGVIEPVPCRFGSAGEITRLVDRIISPLGRRLDESSPMVDARLPDGSRLNAVIPPLALDGPLVTIRRFGVGGLTMADLMAKGAIAADLAGRLEQAVRSRRNILLSGGAGTGKTTLLNALSAFIPETERIVTIEDAAELRLQQEHVVRLEARPPNVEGNGAVTIRDLVRNALRMRPDRIIVGEVRGEEALDMLQAMNTGHSGSLATIHANSAYDALTRLEAMVLTASASLPLRVVREQVVAAIDLVIHLARGAEGRRKVSEVVELCGTGAGHYQIRTLAGEAAEGEPAAG